MEEKMYQSVQQNSKNPMEQLDSYNNVTDKTFMINNGDFKSKNIMKYKLTQGTFHSDDFTGATIGGCQFTNCEFVNCNFLSVNFLGVTFKNCIFDQCNFNQCTLCDVYFVGQGQSSCTFTNSTFQRINLEGNVILNGQQIKDPQQLINIVVGDVNSSNSNIQSIQQINVRDILQQFKCLQKTEDGTFILPKGTAVLTFAQDEGGWRVSYSYNFSGDNQQQEFLLSNTIATQKDEKKLTRQQIIQQIFKLVVSLGQQSMEKVQSTMVKTDIEQIIEAFKLQKTVVQQKDQLIKQLTTIISQKSLQQLRQLVKTVI